MSTGVARNWFDSKGFGFIIPDQEAVDVFVHRHALENVKYLTLGDAVTCSYAWNQIEGGLLAVNAMVNYSVEHRLITRRRPEPVMEPGPVDQNTGDVGHGHYDAAVEHSWFSDWWHPDHATAWEQGSWQWDEGRAQEWWGTQPVGFFTSTHCRGRSLDVFYL